MLNNPTKLCIFAFDAATLFSADYIDGLVPFPSICCLLKLLKSEKNPVSLQFNVGYGADVKGAFGLDQVCLILRILSYETFHVKVAINLHTNCE